MGTSTSATPDRSHGGPTGPVPAIEVVGELVARDEELLTTDALMVAARLHERIDAARAALLRARRARREQLRMAGAAGTVQFTEASRIARDDAQWRAVPSRALTDTWIADLDEPTAPYWSTVIAGHLKVRDAITGRLPGGEPHDAGHQVAVRPRGWQAQDRNVIVDGWPISATALDLALHLTHAARPLLEQGGAPVLVLPDVQSAEEAELWQVALASVEEQLGLPTSTVQVVVCVESLPGATDLEAITYTLRDRLAGMSVDTHAYLASIVQCLGTQTSIPEQGLPGAGNPALRSLTTLVTETARRRGTQVVGGFDARLAQADSRAIDATALITIASAPLAPADVRRAMRTALSGIAGWLEGATPIIGAVPTDTRARIELARAQVWQWRAQGAVLDDGRILDDGMIREWLAETAADLARQRGARGLAAAVELFGDLIRDRDTSRTFTAVAYGRWVAPVPSMDVAYALPDLLLASA